MPLPDLSRAHWWWPPLPEGQTARPDSYADFAFVPPALPAPPTRAVLYLASTAVASVYLAGHRVHHGPPREVAPHAYVDELDLLALARDLPPLPLPSPLSLLSSLRLRGHHLGVKTNFHAPTVPGVMVAGTICGPGYTYDLADPLLWRCALSPAYLPDAPRLHFCIGFGEHVDLTADPDAWLTAPPPPHWTPPALTPNTDRTLFLSRDLPEFTGDTFAAGIVHSDDRGTLLDFGHEVFGFLSLTLTCPPTSSPTTVTLLHGTQLRDDGLPDHTFADGDWRERLKMPAGTRTWHSFEKRSLRCLLVSGAASVGTPTADKHSSTSPAAETASTDPGAIALTCRESHWPLTEVWRNHPAVAALNDFERKLLEVTARTVVLCSDDLLNDTPRRERSQYNDSSIYKHAFPRLFGTWAPYRRWLTQYRRGAGPDGVLRMCYPSPPGATVIPDFSIAFAEHLHDYVDTTGDVGTLHECFASAVAGVTSFSKHEAADGLLTDVPGWTFLCNSFEVCRHPKSAGLNALYAAGYGHLAALARQLGDPRADAFAARHAALRQAWRAAFFLGDRIADASPVPDADTHWHNYHFDAHLHHFKVPAPPAFAYHVSVDRLPPRLRLIANGPVKLYAGDRLLADLTPDAPWFKPPCYHPFAVDLPAHVSTPGSELLFEFSTNGIDNELFLDLGDTRILSAHVGPLASTDNTPTALRAAAKHPAPPRPWTAPLHSQITVGYSVASAMLTDAEALPLVRACVRDTYHVPWLKRTTPLGAVETSDERLLRDRAVLCNTPHSLHYFLHALRRLGLHTESRALIHTLFAPMLQYGATALWEEFAPRSSTCHAWGATIVEHLLPPPPP